jgi:hypothetical protein
MDSNRKAALVAGILFIVADLVGVPSMLLSSPLLTTSNYLANIAPHASQIALAALLIFAMAVACAGIAFSLYPVLKRYNAGLAIGSVGFRTIEAMFEIVVGVIFLLLISLSQEFIKSGSSDSSYLQSMGRMLLAGSDWLNNVIIPATWCIGALMYSFVFFQARLLPRWLTVWGLVVYPLPIVASILTMFRLIGPTDASWGALVYPAALQELVLAVWLIAKGFTLSASITESIQQ